MSIYWYWFIIPSFHFLFVASCHFARAFFLLHGAIFHQIMSHTHMNSLETATKQFTEIALYCRKLSAELLKKCVLRRGKNGTELFTLYGFRFSVFGYFMDQKRKSDFCDTKKYCGRFLVCHLEMESNIWAGHIICRLASIITLYLLSSLFLVHMHNAHRHSRQMSSRKI